MIGLVNIQLDGVFPTGVYFPAAIDGLGASLFEGERFG
jgi:hypothetical protein